MHKISSHILLVLVIAWAAALCVVVHPLLGLLTVGLLSFGEVASNKAWIEPGTMELMGWALFVLILIRTTSPAASVLFGISGFLIHSLYALLTPQKKEGYSP